MGRIFFIMGSILLLAAVFLIWQRYTPQRLAFNSYTGSSTGTHTSQKTPERIDIARLDIALPIVPLSITEGKWSATDKGVGYLSGTPLPGEIGNSVLYGHNWPNLLGKLVHIQSGDAIDISFSDGTVKHFRVVYTMTVTPDEIHILGENTDTRITLYTCSGFLDRKRFVVVASLDP